MKKILQSRRGMSIVEIPIILMILVVLLLLTVQISAVVMKKQALDTYVQELVRYIEVYGRIDATVYAYKNRLDAQHQFAPAVSYSRSGRIQLGENFGVTAAVEMELANLWVTSITIPLQASAEGKSEVYFK